MFNKVGIVMRMAVRSNIIIMNRLNSTTTFRRIVSKELCNSQVPSSYSCVNILESLSSLNTPPCNIELPVKSKIQDFLECPNLVSSIVKEKSDPIPMFDVNEPQDYRKIEKHAARLIVIRRKKMKKHKLRKLRKRMKFEWAKVRQRRELKKELAFQATLLAQIREAERFDAAEYVKEKLKKVKTLSSSKNVNDRKDKVSF